MRVERATNPDTDYARGLVTPVARAIAHLAFAAAEIARHEELTGELVTNVKTDLREASRHMSTYDVVESGPFLSVDAINEFSNLQSVLLEFNESLNPEAEEMPERIETMLSIQNLIHNTTTFIARTERDMFGISASPGRLL